MKITCQSCQSKYNVADEKVHGKVVKIRCRKCGATIVVNGATNGSAEATETPPVVSSKAALSADPWHVNLAENDQRTMSLAELVDGYNSGLVTRDTFVWTEGMGDWKPLGEVEAVLAALNEHAGPGSGVSEGSSEAYAPPAPEPSAPMFTSSAAAPYEAPAAYGAPASEPGSRPEPRRAAVKRETRGRDLFATGLGDSHGAQDIHGGVETSAPLMNQGAMSPIDDPSKLTGERNENSVLFSLAVLTKTAEERAPAFSDAPSSTREDSGLIDLKALAAKTESMRPATGMVDGLPFSSPLGAMPPLGAPLGALDSPLGEAQAKSTLPRIIGLVAGVALLLVLGIVIGIKFFAVAPSLAPVASAGTAAVPSASAEAQATASAASSAPVDSAAAAASASVAAANAKPKANVGGPVWHPQVAAGGGKPGPAGGGAAATGGGGAATPTPAAAPAKKNDCGCNGDLMCLMKCSTH